MNNPLSIQIISLIFFLLVLVGLSYIISVAWSLRLLNKICQDNFIPRWWLILAFFPFGFILSRQVEEVMKERFYLTFPEIDIIRNPSKYRNSGWVLFQEQYDRKSGDHQGTSFYILGENDYLLVSYTHESSTEKLQLNDVSEIVVPYPGKMLRAKPEKFQWARLIRKNDDWYIQNERAHTIIPIYETVNDDSLKEGSVRFCTPQNLIPTILQNGDYFIAHTTEFRIFRLPKLTLYEIMPDQKKRYIKPIFEDEVRINNDGNIVLSNDASIIIKGNFVSISADTSILYCSKFLPEKSLTNGTFVLPIHPGDLFEIKGSPAKFLIDFDPNT